MLYDYGMSLQINTDIWLVSLRLFKCVVYDETCYRKYCSRCSRLRKSLAKFNVKLQSMRDPFSILFETWVQFLRNNMMLLSTVVWNEQKAECYRLLFGPLCM